ncbi:MAG TPA: hypothetical protein VMR33_03665 [Candidatus Baltobacteraceae bacterium]|jgi:hypothetical protein|nr:hypothetical protein [Candidatus Baltobacteraceae bacterium]
MAPPAVLPLVFVALIIWRVYRRVRRSIGRQRVQPKRLTAGIVIYSVICVLIALAALAHPRVLAGLGAGLLLGVPLGLVALRFTRFETTREGRFYTAHPYIGISIAALLVVRVFYRMTTILGTAAQTQKPPMMMQSPLTLSLLGLLAGYYITYYTGVLVNSPKT